MNNCYCSTGNISKSDDIESLEKILILNYDVISKFNYIVIQHNSTLEGGKYIEAYNNVWKKIYGNDVIILPHIENRGHTFGTMDLDNNVVNHAKTLPIEFIYKSANDMLFSQNLFSLKLSDEFQFYFLQGIGYTGLTQFNYNLNEYLNNYMNPEFFYPQTTFYIISKNVDYINDNIEIDNAYNYCKSLKNYSGKAWEFIEGFSCENFLKKCILRNKFKYKHMITDSTFYKILQLVDNYKICDCSHKNIYIEEIGVCHFQYINQNCIII